MALSKCANTAFSGVQVLSASQFQESHDGKIETRSGRIGMKIECDREEYKARDVR